MVIVGRGIFAERMDFGAIYSLAGIDLFRPRIQKCAMFAVADHNKKANSNLSYVGIEEAATEAGEMIYYLLLTANDNGSLKLFKTAVTLVSSINYLKSLGLEEYVGPISLSPSFPPSLPPILPVQSHVESAAQFAVHSFNLKKKLHLKFVRVVKLGGLRENTNRKTYFLTVLVVDHSQNYFLYETNVNVPIQVGLRLESTGLKFMCQVDPCKVLDAESPFTTPIWVSDALLRKAASLYTDNSASEHVRCLREMVASNLTLDNVRSELIPFLSENDDDVTDSDLMSSAHVLDLVISDLQNIQDAHLLLPLIEHLCGVDEPSVREVAHDLLSEIQRKIASFLELAKPNISSCQSYTPLLASVVANSLRRADLLLKGGVDPDVPGLGILPLMYAAEHGQADMVRCLLNARANPNVTNQEGLTPIEVAAVERFEDVVTILFPVTSPISSYLDWSVTGIMKHVHSQEARVQRELKQEETCAEAKFKGDDALREYDYMMAASWYTRAMAGNPSNAVLLSNRSLCWQRLSAGELALKDAMACIELKPDWSRAYYRAGLALNLLMKYDEASKMFSKAQDLDPNDKGFFTAFHRALQDSLQMD